MNTPRTDAQENFIYDMRKPKRGFVPSSLARQLEAELNQANKTIQELRNEIDILSVGSKEKTEGL